MEGVTGVTNWEEVDHNKPAYPQFQKQMSLEVAAACEGAIRAGAKEIFVKDAHYSGRNILPSYLPKRVKILTPKHFNFKSHKETVKTFK